LRDFGHPRGVDAVPDTIDQSSSATGGAMIQLTAQRQGTTALVISGAGYGPTNAAAPGSTGPGHAAQTSIVEPTTT
jgi:hypothetical protein